MLHQSVRYRSVRFVIIVLSLMCLASPALFLTHSHASSASPSVATGKQDYHPGEMADIVGAGFQPGETVMLQILHATEPSDDATSPAHQPWYVTADNTGSFQTTWDIPANEDEKGAMLQLTATGLTSGWQAVWTFYDSGPLTAGALTPPVAVEGQAFSNVTVFHFTDANSLAVASDFTATVNTEHQIDFLRELQSNREFQTQFI